MIQTKILETSNAFILVINDMPENIIEVTDGSIPPKNLSDNNWELLGKMNYIMEEQWKMIIPPYKRKIKKAWDDRLSTVYENYGRRDENDIHMYCESAAESGISLVEKNVNLKNPILFFQLKS